MSTSLPGLSRLFLLFFFRIAGVPGVLAPDFHFLLFRIRGVRGVLRSVHQTSVSDALSGATRRVDMMRGLETEGDARVRGAACTDRARGALER